MTVVYASAFYIASCYNAENVTQICELCYELSQCFWLSFQLLIIPAFTAQGFRFSRTERFIKTLP